MMNNYQLQQQENHNDNDQKHKKLKRRVTTYLNNGHT